MILSFNIIGNIRANGMHKHVAEILIKYMESFRIVVRPHTTQTTNILKAFLDHFVVNDSSFGSVTEIYSKQKLSNI